MSDNYFDHWSEQHGGCPVQCRALGGLRVWPDGASTDGDFGGRGLIYHEPPENPYGRLKLRIARHVELLDRAAEKFKTAKANAMAVGSKMLLPQLHELKATHDTLYDELQNLRRQLAATPEAISQAREQEVIRERDRRQMQDMADARVEIQQIVLCTEQGQQHQPLTESED